MADNRILTRISDAELDRRWAALRAGMEAHGLDALVVQSQNDWMGGYARWFTDLPAHNGYPKSVVFHRDKPMTVIGMGAFDSSRDLGGRDPVQRGVGTWCGTPSFLTVAYTTDYEGRLAAEDLLKHGVRHVGLVGPGGMAHGFVQAIRDGLEGRARITDATEWVDRIKAVKSAEELKLLEASAKLQDDVFARVLGAIRPGMRDIDVTALAQHEALVLGSEQGIFLGGSARVGQRSNFIPRSQQGRRMEKGDHLSLLIEVNGPGGFYTEIARTFVLGRASNELLEGFQAVKEAQDHTLSLMKPGTPSAAIAQAHDDYMRAHGMPAEKRLYAHGQGYDMVERPLIRRDETMSIESNMCFAVHPGFETESIFAVICDNYIVGADGPGECLHKIEKKVFELA